MLPPDTQLHEITVAMAASKRQADREKAAMKKAEEEAKRKQRFR